MSLKLNLGAGRIILPVTPETQPGHLAPMPEICFEPGWQNVDRHALPGIDEAVDLFRFPWVRSSNGSPWNTGTVDAIYCSHLIEHIPHRVELATALPLAIARPYREMVDTLDGWFVFFAECWRLLRPGGLLYLVTPFGLSAAALADPTHTRLIVPGSFSYLKPERPDAPFDYRIPFEFEVHDQPTLRYRASWAWVASAVNEGRLSPQEAFQMVFSHFDVADEIRLSLRAVKDG